MFYKVKSVKALDNLILEIEFENGILKFYDIKPLLEKWLVFKALYNDKLYKQVKVDIGGYGISWNDEIDLSCNELWENGVDRN